MKLKYMITKFKIFESVKDIEVGDWVYCHEQYTDNKSIEMFISSHVGECIKVLEKNNKYLIEYDYYEELKRYDDVKEFLHYSDGYYTYNKATLMMNDEILFSSPNKVAVEEYMKMYDDITKYNL